jgi:hypothetical protein
MRVIFPLIHWQVTKGVQDVKPYRETISEYLARKGKIKVLKPVKPVEFYPVKPKGEPMLSIGDSFKTRSGCFRVPQAKGA